MNEKSRPGEKAALPAVTAATESIVIPGPDIVAYLEAGFVCLVVTTNAVKSCTRRKVYFNLPSASAAVRRAEKNGNVARIVLAKLIPVGETSC
jgi:hypothetical protein